jgi:hypothetical protein
MFEEIAAKFHAVSPKLFIHMNGFHELPLVFLDMVFSKQV